MNLLSGILLQYSSLCLITQHQNLVQSLPPKQWSMTGLHEMLHENRLYRFDSKNEKFSILEKFDSNFHALEYKGKTLKTTCRNCSNQFKEERDKAYLKIFKIL